MIGDFLQDSGAHGPRRLMARRGKDPEQDRDTPDELVASGGHPTGGESAVYVLLMESSPGVGDGGWWAVGCSDGCAGRGASASQPMNGGGGAANRWPEETVRHPPSEAIPAEQCTESPAGGIGVSWMFWDDTEP